MNTVSLWPQDDNTPLKRCSNPDCKNPWQPATPEFFRRDGNHLRNPCKECSIAKYHRPENKARLKVYYQQPEVRERKNATTKKRYHDPVIGPHVQEQKRARVLNYFARKRSVQGTYTPAQIQVKLKAQKHKCYYCSVKFGKKKDGKYIYHIDHTFPLSRVVGTDIPANSIDYIVLACPKCNMNKKNKFPWEWSEGGRLL